MFRINSRRMNHCRPRLEMLEHRLVLSTFHVNSLLDTEAVNLKSGKDASGHISLRSAIEAANAKPNADTIILPAGTITLTIAGANEDNAETGDLDIRGNLTIKGKGAGVTTIDGNNLDRVIDVLGGKVSISNVTIQHGRTEEGAGLLNQGGKVTLSAVRILNNVAIGGDGGAGGQGSGGGSGTIGEGGGVFNEAGSLSINNSVIAGNQAVGAREATAGRVAAATAEAPSAARTGDRLSAAMVGPAETAPRVWAVGFSMRPAQMFRSQGPPSQPILPSAARVAVAARAARPPGAPAAMTTAEWESEVSPPAASAQRVAAAGMEPGVGS